MRSTTIDLYHCPWHLWNNNLMIFFYIYLIKIRTHEGANSYQNSSVATQNYDLPLMGIRGGFSKLLAFIPTEECATSKLYVINLVTRVSPVRLLPKIRRQFSLTETTRTCRNVTITTKLAVLMSLLMLNFVNRR